MDKVVQTGWDGCEQNQLVVTGEAALVPFTSCGEPKHAPGWDAVCV